MAKQGIEELITLDITKVCNGYFVTNFDLHFRELILNGIDPKTSHSAQRSLTLTATFRPEDDRQNFTVTLNGRRNPAGERPKKFHGNLGRRDGQLKVVENCSIQTDEPIQLHEESGYSKVESWVQVHNLCGGALINQWKEALIQVAENIEDPNTDPTAVRSIVVKVSFSLSDDQTNRSMGSGKFTVTPNLVKRNPTPFNLNLYHLDEAIGVREHVFEQRSMFD